MPGDRMNRKAQLQTLEPILIVIVLAIIAGAALMFFLRFSERQSIVDARAFDREEDLAAVKRVTAMPELSCPRDVSAGTYCIDLGKAVAFSELSQRRDVAMLYRPMFGDAVLVLSWIDLDTGTLANLTLYNQSLNTSQTSQSRTYGTVFDPLTGERHFATLTIRRSS
jgi:hypothetical protein